MSIANENAPVTVSSREELAATLPSMIGFTPTRSVVAVLLNGQRVVVSMRMDLPNTYSDVAPQVLAVTSRLGADSTVLAIYAPSEQLEALRCSAAEVIADLVMEGLQVHDALLIDGDRCWSLTSHGNAIAIPQSTTPLEVQRVLSGLPAVAESRDDIAKRFTPRPDLAPSEAMFADATVDLEVSVSDKAEMVWNALAGLARLVESDIDDDVLRARLILGVNDGRIRDFILCAVGCTEAEAKTNRLVDVVVTTALRAPEHHRAQVAATAAALLAMCGDSSVPVTCMLTLATGTNLAQLVTEAVATAVSPSQLRGWMRDSMPAIAKALTEAP